MRSNETRSRRNVLKTSGAILGGSAVVGTAAASGSDLEMSTLAPSSVTGNDAKLFGEVTNLSSDDYYISRFYFEFGIAGNGLANQTREQTCSDRFSRCQREGETIDDWVHNLKPGTDYEVRVFAEANDGETDYGDVVTFTTEPGPAVDQFDVTTQTSGGTIEATVDWTVSHQANGTLDKARTALTYGGFSYVTKQEESVSGGSASGTHVLEANEDDVDAVRVDVWDSDSTNNYERESL